MILQTTRLDVTRVDAFLPVFWILSAHFYTPMMIINRNRTRETEQATTTTSTSTSLHLESVHSLSSAIADSTSKFDAFLEVVERLDRDVEGLDGLRGRM